MGAFEFLILAVIIAEILFTIQVVCNYVFALKHYRCERTYRPTSLLIVPCKGLDETFDINIRSFYEQDYQNYKLWFVVEDDSDPAYAALERLKKEHAGQSQAQDIRILTAGQTTGCSQKLHNLLFACRQAPADIQAVIFADSDACAGPRWLLQIVWPLDNPKVGLASGYRWFIPQKNNLASLALSALNAKICQLLGRTRFNLAWGGSMAVRRETFERLKIDRLWSSSLSDDLSLSQAVRNAGMRTQFVPGCVVASYQSTTWPRLWEFARRQFIITRIYAPRTWLFGLFGAVLSTTGLWGGLALAIWALREKPAFWLEYVALFVVFLGCQIFRAILRQKLAVRLLPNDRDTMHSAQWADWLGFWAWGVLLLAVIVASAYGRTITWRGIQYYIKSPTDIEVLGTKTLRSNT